MKTEALEYLNIQPEGVYADLTCGGGSHSEEIAKRLTSGKLIAVDRDADAVNFSREKLKKYKDKIYFVKDNFVNAEKIIKNLGFEKINGALIDLGLSSYQIQSDRGFAYSGANDSKLDMRADREQELDAAYVVNNFDKNKLKEILYKYGEEKYTELIVREIVKRRETKAIETTHELADIIKYAVRNVGYSGGHPAKKTFMAVRIFVNDEINNIEPALDSVEKMLESKGRLVAISFHGGEDRVVKKSFARYETDCECPKVLPVCVCKKRATSRILTRKPVLASREEIEINAPSKPAKLRAIEKL